MSRMKVIVVLLAALVLVVGLSTTALADAGLPPDTATNPSENDCIGEARSTRNTPGGDRAYGGFGEVQPGVAQTVEPNYGQFLQTYRAANCP